MLPTDEASAIFHGGKVWKLRVTRRIDHLDAFRSREDAGGEPTNRLGIALGVNPVILASLLNLRLQLLKLIREGAIVADHALRVRHGFFELFDFGFERDVPGLCLLHVPSSASCCARCLYIERRPGLSSIDLTCRGSFSEVTLYNRFE